MARNARKDATPANNGLPRFMTIREVAKTKVLPEYCIRQMIKQGTLPTRVIQTGNKVLLNYDLLLENLSKQA